MRRSNLASFRRLYFHLACILSICIVTVEDLLLEVEILSTSRGFENAVEHQILMRYQRKRTLFFIIKVWGDRINTRFFTGAVFELSHTIEDPLPENEISSTFQGFEKNEKERKLTENESK